MPVSYRSNHTCLQYIFFPCTLAKSPFTHATPFCTSPSRCAGPKIMGSDSSADAMMAFVKSLSESSANFSRIGRIFSWHLSDPICFTRPGNDLQVSYHNKARTSYKNKARRLYNDTATRQSQNKARTLYYNTATRPSQNNASFLIRSFWKHLLG